MRWCPVRGFFSAAQVALRAPCEANVATAPVGASPGVDFSMAVAWRGEGGDLGMWDIGYNT